ncbi:MAG: SCO family protein, partial [Candidatus Kapaibacterium sp.]
MKHKCVRFLKIVFRIFKNNLEYGQWKIFGGMGTRIFTRKIVRTCEERLVGTAIRFVVFLLTAFMTPRTIQRLLWGVLAVSLILIGGLSVAKWEKSDTRHLEDYGAVPNFSLLDQSGATVSLQNFEGHIWVADMIFTHCGSICPMLTSKMIALQSALKDDPGVRFASVTVDPRHDTPDTLRAYA